MDGRSKCEMLREMRRQIAHANGIPYMPTECPYDVCTGRCPKADGEVEFLNAALNEKAKNGATVMIGVLEKHNEMYYEGTGSGGAGTLEPSAIPEERMPAQGPDGYASQEAELPEEDGYDGPRRASLLGRLFRRRRADAWEDGEAQEMVQDFPVPEEPVGELPEEEVPQFSPDMRITITADPMGPALEHVQGAEEIPPQGYSAGDGERLSDTAFFTGDFIYRNTEGDFSVEPFAGEAFPEKEAEVQPPKAEETPQAPAEPAPVKSVLEEFREQEQSFRQSIEESPDYFDGSKVEEKTFALNINMFEEAMQAEEEIFAAARAEIGQEQAGEVPKDTIFSDGDLLWLQNRLASGEEETGENPEGMQG